MATDDRDRRRTIWLALLCAVLILAIAQIDEHRRYERAQAAYLDVLSKRAAASAAYLDQVSEFLSKPKETRGEMPPPPPNVAQRTPTGPPRDRYIFVARIRQALCLAAFAVAAAMPGVWGLSSPQFRRRHGQLIAEMMLALALFGTIGMMLGGGHLANWREFRIGTNAAGYGLVLVPLGVVAVLLASRGDNAESAGSDAGDAVGGSNT
jgi:hypothetical protein